MTKIMIALLMTLFISVSASPETIERTYVDTADVCPTDEGFYLHIGENNWILTTQLQSDSTGLFTYAHNIKIDSPSMEYVRKWQCPYCKYYWPIGKPCANVDCPSRYK